MFMHMGIFVCVFVRVRVCKSESFTVEPCVFL